MKLKLSKTTINNLRTPVNKLKPLESPLVSAEKPAISEPSAQGLHKRTLGDSEDLARGAQLRTAWRHLMGRTTKQISRKIGGILCYIKTFYGIFRYGLKELT